MSPREWRADSDYLVNLLGGPSFSPAPLQCQKHSVHLISSPRRADIKESVYWHKTEMELTTTQSTCLLLKEGRKLLRTILCWIYSSRGLPCLTAGNNPHCQSGPQLSPDLLPWKRLSFLPGTGTFTASVLEQQGKACWLSSKHTQCGTALFYTPVPLLLSHTHHRSQGTQELYPSSSQGEASFYCALCFSWESPCLVLHHTLNHKFSSS